MFAKYCGLKHVYYCVFDLAPDFHNNMLQVDMDRAMLLHKRIRSALDQRHKRLHVEMGSVNDSTIIEV